MSLTNRGRLTMFASFLFCVATTSYSHGQEIDKAKETEIRRMLELTGASAMATQVISQMLDGMKGTRGLSADIVARLKKKLNTDELIEKLIPVYDKYYSIDDLKSVNAFYASPAGKKLLSSMPLIMKESMTVGQEWGAKLGMQVDDEIRNDASNGK